MLTIYGTLGWVWQKTGIGTSQFSSHTLRHFRDLKSANIPGVAGRWGCMHWEPLANFESNRFNRFNRLHDFLWITLKHCIAKSPKLCETYQDQLKAPSSEKHIWTSPSSVPLLDGFTTLADERADLHALHSDDLEARRVDTYDKTPPFMLSTQLIMIVLDIVHNDI